MVDLKYVGCVLLSVLFLSCGEAERSDEGTKQFEIKDDAGRVVRFDKAPETVLGLAPSVTEVLYAVADTHNIIGRTHQCTYPSAVQHKPVVNIYPGVDVEKVLQLAPDVVLVKHTMIHPEDVAQLEQSGIKIILQDYEPLDSLYSAILETGVLLNCEAKAKKLVAGIQQELAVIKDKVNRQKQHPAVIVMIDDELYAYGKGTVMEEKVNLAGGEMALDATINQQYPKLTREYLLRANPDYLLFDRMDTARFFANFPEMKLMDAYKNNKVVKINSELAARPGPRVAQAVRELYAIFYDED